MNLNEWFRIPEDILDKHVSALSWKASEYPRPGGSSGAFEIESIDHDYRALLKPGRADAEQLPRCQAAMERLAFMLGQLIDIPIPPVQLIKGFPPAKPDWPCCLVLKPKGAIWTWGLLQKKGTLGFLPKELFIEGAKAIPFHIWIDGHDRANSGNILFVENPDLQASSFFFIDHSTSMLGAEQVGIRHWRRGSPQDFVPCQIFIEFIQQITPSLAEGTIDKIHNLGDNIIVDMVESIPEDFLNPEEKRLVTGGLIQRKKEIRVLVNRWLKHYGRLHV